MSTRTLSRTTCVAITSALMCSAIFADAASAACFRHTFEACTPERSESYTVEVDTMTGRTWLKKARQDAGLAELAKAAADNFANGEIVDNPAPRTSGAPAVSSWRARVNPSLTLAKARGPAAQ